MAHFSKIISALLLITSFIAPAHKLGVTYGVGYNTEVKDVKQIFPVSYSYYNRATPYIGIIYRDSINRFISIKRKNIEFEFNMFHGLIAPGNFFVFTSQHFEFQYLTMQTFMLGMNYYPTFKKLKKKNRPGK